jgi:hypothetical protein
MESTTHAHVQLEERAKTVKQSTRHLASSTTLAVTMLFAERKPILLVNQLN